MDIETLILTAIGGSCCLVLLGGIVLIIVGTIMKARFGVNLGKAECSECGTPAPLVRVPQTTYEMLWGGWTCAECGQRCDKWGRSVE